MSDSVRDLLAEAVLLYENYGLLAGHRTTDSLAIGRWINGARAALAATPAVGGERDLIEKWQKKLVELDDLIETIAAPPASPPAVDGEAMLRARNIVESHIFVYGYVPNPDMLKDAIAVALAPPASPLRGREIDTADDLEFLDLEHLDGSASPPEQPATPDKEPQP